MDQPAWDALVERYLPLVRGEVDRRGLDEVDGDDVCRTVWLRLVDRVDDLGGPDALAEWLAATTRDECRRLLAVRSRMTPVDLAGVDVVGSGQRVEPRTAARAAFTWRSVDAQPMTLLRDSALDAAATVHSAGDPGRLLAFGRDGLTVELEVGAGAVRGQVLPAQAATVTLQQADADDRVVAADGAGRFRMEKVGSGPIRFVVTTSEQTRATEWGIL